MSDLNRGGVTKNRRPAFKGTLVQRVSHGREVVSKWPKKQGKATLAKTKDNRDWFRAASYAAKYLDPKTQKILASMRVGTPILPRDLAFAMFAGRLFSFKLQDGRKIYSMAAMQDISESLDVIGQLPGSMLWRGPEWWTYSTAPAKAGLFLQSQPNGAPPAWASAAGGVIAGSYQLPATHIPVAAEFPFTASGDAILPVASDDDDFGMLVDFGQMVNSRHRFIGKALPLAGDDDWSIETHFLHEPVLSGVQALDLCLFEQPTGKFVSLGLRYEAASTNVRAVRATLTTAGTAIVSNLDIGTPALYAKASHVKATNRYHLGFSVNGKRWSEFDEADATGFTTRATHIGFIMRAASTTARNPAIYVDQWKQSWPLA